MADKGGMKKKMTKEQLPNEFKKDLRKKGYYGPADEYNQKAKQTAKAFLDSCNIEPEYMIEALEEVRNG